MEFALFATNSGLVLPTRSASKHVTRRRPRLGICCANTAAASDAPQKRMQNAALRAGVVVSAVCNRVAHRMQLVPMADYTYMIAQGCTLAYTLVYGLILSTRVRSRAVSKAQLALAASPRYLRIFALVGTFEALVFVMQLWASARLPGVLIVILSQALLPCTMVVSALALGRRYRGVQLVGIAAVIAGVLICTLPAAGRGQAEPLAAAIFAAANALLACAVVLKEQLLQRRRFDVFIVNTFGSTFQALATLALFPVSVALATTLPAAQYLGGGLHALFNASYMPWLTLMYVVCNITFNIMALTLVKSTSAPTVILTNLLSVPIVALVFCLPLPLLVASPFSWSICLGLVIIIGGVLLYNCDTLLLRRPRMASASDM